MRKRFLKIVAVLVLLSGAVISVRIFFRIREIDNDLSRQIQQHKARESAHALLTKVLALEASDTFANPKLSAVEEMKAMIDRFQNYYSLAFTPKDSFDISEAYNEAGQRILFHSLFV